MNLHYRNLHIRDAGRSDLPQLVAWWNDGAVMNHAGFPNGLGTTVDREWERLLAQTDTIGRRLVIEKDGCPIGEMSYQAVGDGAVDIGIKICIPDEQERGSGRVLLSMLIKALFAMRFQRIVLDTDLENRRAQHVYEKVGFTRLGVAHDSWRNSLGQLRSSVGYEMKPGALVDFAEEDLFIRQAVSGDEPILAQVQTQSWKSAFQNILPAEELCRLTELNKAQAMYERVLQKPEIHVSIGCLGSSPQIITAWSRNRAGLGDDSAELICIHALPGSRRRGFGSAMMKQVLAEMRRAGYRSAILWVFSDNRSARCFYEKLGFSPTNRTQCSYGVTEVMYARELGLDPMDEKTVASVCNL